MKISKQIEERNKKLEKRLKDKKHKVKVTYKYAEEGKVYVDRPKVVHHDEKPLINGEAFIKDYVALVVKYLKNVKKKDRTLALCQVEDRSHVFIDAVKPKLVKALGWEGLK